MMTGELLAARRDASMLNSPGRAARYHVQTRAGEWKAACRGPAPDGWDSRRVILLADFTALPLDRVPPALRCRRAGCRQHWP